MKPTPNAGDGEPFWRSFVSRYIDLSANSLVWASIEDERREEELTLRDGLD